VEPTAKSLILDLLSTVRGGAMPVRALVASGELFDIAENNVRVELARLAGRGLVERDGRGAYRIALGARAVQEHVASWTRIEERVVTWRGAWIGVHTAHLPRVPRASARRRARALEWLGFRDLEAGLAVRPDNLRGGVAEVRQRLRDLGLEPTAPVFAITDLDDAADAHARGLWDSAALRRDYRELQERLAASEERLPRRSLAGAMIETFLLGGRVIRQLVRDPLLPEPIVPAGERKALVEALRRYDRLGRECWSRFMRSHGAPYRRSPVNVGGLVVPAGGMPAAVGGTP
jgi:phenylacetic acid degradation operon negative regulatory protein